MGQIGYNVHTLVLVGVQMSMVQIIELELDKLSQSQHLIGLLNKGVYNCACTRKTYTFFYSYKKCILYFSYYIITDWCCLCVCVFLSIIKRPIFVRRVPSCFSIEIKCFQLRLQQTINTLLEAWNLDFRCSAVVSALNIISKRADFHAVETTRYHMVLFFYFVF